MLIQVVLSIRSIYNTVQPLNWDIAHFLSTNIIDSEINVITVTFVSSILLLAMIDFRFWLTIHFIDFNLFFEYHILDKYLDNSTLAKLLAPSITL